LNRGTPSDWNYQCAVDAECVPLWVGHSAGHGACLAHRASASEGCHPVPGQRLQHVCSRLKVPVAALVAVVAVAVPQDESARARPARVKTDVGADRQMHTSWCDAGLSSRRTDSQAEGNASLAHLGSLEAAFSHVPERAAPEVCAAGMGPVPVHKDRHQQSNQCIRSHQSSASAPIQ
jgi:hypothetical protein